MKKKWFKGGVVACCLVVAGLVVSGGWWRIAGGSSDNNRQSEVERLERELFNWEVVISAQPNFEPAYVRMAVVAAQLGNVKQAKEYVEKARWLAPNNPLLDKVLGFVESQEVLLESGKKN